MSFYDDFARFASMQEKPTAPTRTPTSVYDALLDMIAEDRRLSGKISKDVALIRVTRAAMSNKTLDKALRTVVRSILDVFPGAYEGSDDD